MFNPLLSEMVAREQYKDRLREAEQDRLVAAGMARQPADRVDLRTSLANLLISLRHVFGVLARAG
jgi:hypothetical protein